MDISTSTIAGAALATLVAIWTLDVFLLSRASPGEPAYIRPRVPVIGHLLGLARGGVAYAYQASASQLHQKGIATIPVIFSVRIYVVTGRSLVAGVQRAASRAISFAGFVQTVNKTWNRLGPAALARHDDPAVHAEAKAIITRGLMPGDELDRLNLVSVTEQIRMLGELAGRGEEKEIELMEWVRRVIVASNSTALYGPQNPFRDPAHDADFWTFHRGAGVLLLDFLPRLLAPRTVRARDANIARYRAYHAASGHLSASAVVRDRHALWASLGWTDTEQAGMTFGLDAAIFPNHTPTAFWCLIELLSRPELVESIRAELVTSGAVTRFSSSHILLDISRLCTACPLLLSTFQETQRIHTIHAQIRQVTRATTLTDDTTGTKYTLRPGSYLQVPSQPALRDPATWGSSPEPSIFHPTRFMTLLSQKTNSEILTPGTFPVWGIAPHICPARQFASSSIMALMALTIMRFDVESANDKTIKLPEGYHDLATVPYPKTKVHLRMRPREGWNGDRVKWEASVGEGGTKIPIAIN
ncbi:cytochrome P450 [Echria macrotheca]|uniref:Cytochrome P450 n=1 Tax=Echria macrotheca TaxID=438768 RepID=A0AAJ0BMZ1_9PEZI|nr:cytochrome P450 [Echria macrotheca]